MIRGLALLLICMSVVLGADYYSILEIPKDAD